MKKQNVDLKNSIAKEEQQEKKDRKLAVLLALVKPYFKYILATIAIILAVIAVFFGESKFTLTDTASANLSFNKLYYLNVETGERFLTLKDAVDKSVTDNPTGSNTIRAINNREETTVVTVPSGKTITLDLNGKTVTYNIDAQSAETAAITNNGTLTVSGNGTLTTSLGLHLIENIGTVNMSQTGTVSNTNSGSYSVIHNSGTVNKTGIGTVISESTNGYTISGGNINISAGTVETKGRDAINTSGNVTITGGTIKHTSTTFNGSTIYIGGAGTFTMSGGTVEKDGIGDAGNIVFNSTGNATITGGTIKVGSTSGSAYALFNQSSGNMTISNAEIIHEGTITHAQAAAVVNNTGTIEIGEGTEISSIEEKGINNYGTGTVTVTGGTIESTNSNAIYNNSTGTIILGTLGEGVEIDIPVVVSKNGTSVSNSSGAFKFYDGEIFGLTREQLINGTVTEVEPGYQIVYGTDTYEGTTYKTAYLSSDTVFDFNTANNMNKWNFSIYPERFNVVYDAITRMNTITINGASGWEYLSIPFQTVTGNSYKVTFDYQNETEYNTTNNNAYAGLGAQILTETNGTDNTAVAIETLYLPRQINSGKYEIEFTATSNETMILFNFGMIRDGVATTVKLGNFAITEEFDQGDSLGTLPNLSIIEATFNGYYTARTGGTAVTSATTVGANPGTYYAQVTFNNNYRNARTDETYSTLQEALRCVASGDTVVVENSVTETKAPIVPQGKTVTIETTSGIVTTLNDTSLKNNGNLTITGTGKIESTTTAITNTNTGTLTIGANDGTISVTGPEITGTTTGINNAGTLNLYDGKISGSTNNSITGAGTVNNATNCVTVKTTVNGVETAVNGPAAPTITAKLNNSSGATYTSGTWTNQNVFIQLTDTNVGAGIQEYQWYENGAWTTRALTTTNNVGEITYTVNRDETIRFRAIDNNGVISEEGIIVIRRDATNPTITVSPASATVCKTKSVTITAEDTGGSGLSNNNSYQYYLSTSGTALSGGSWTNYTSGTAFTIGSGKNGTFYLFVKRVSDNVGNISTANGTAQAVSGTTYQKFGTYVFDNTAPTVMINTESMYVTDGIVTRLDGTNNANGSHISSGTTWSDISGNSKNGTITGGTWGANYLEFNGSSSWVNLGVMNSNYQTIDVTFSTDTIKNQCIIGNWEGGGGGIYLNANGYIVGEYYVGSYKTLTSNVKVETGKVYNAQVTFDGTTVKLYVDGILAISTAASGTIGVPSNSTVMALGTNPGGSSPAGSYLDGKIYSVGVYNKALTAAQVLQNAQAGMAAAGGATNAGTITYTMRFSEDVSGFDTNDITITNGTKGTFATVTASRLFTVQATTAASQNNTQTITLAANGATDAAGNGNAATSKNVVIDRVGPTKTSVEIKNLTTTGYDVYVYGVTDGGAGINRVTFPTWTSANNQDDLIAGWNSYPNATSVGTMQSDGTTWVFHVNNADHNNEAGTYITHVYMYDNLGNQANFNAQSSGITVPSVTLTFNSQNLLTGLYDQGYANMNGQYTISNNVVTVQGNTDDGYVYTTGKVYLEANKTYKFTCTTNGTYGTASTNVEAFLMLNLSPTAFTYDSYLRMGSTNYEFTPTTTGVYTLRLDVNKTGQSNTFSNISIVHTETKSVGAGAAIGTLPTLSRRGYTLNGWYTATSGGTKIATTTAAPSSNTTYYAQWGATNYTITLNPNSGTYNGSTSNATVTKTYNQQEELGYPTRTGYTFVQWKTSDGVLYDKNLLKNATAMTSIGTSSSNAAGTWRYASTGKADNDPRTVISVSDAPISGISKGFQIVGNGTSYDISQDAVPVTVGNTYTISVWAKGTGTLNLQCGNSTYAQKTYALSNATTWKKYSYTFVAGTNGSANNNQTNIYFGNRGTGTLQICGMKLEENKGFTEPYWNKNATATTLVAEWVDDIVPVIVSATASTTTDIASYVDFNATDAGSQIKYYNITTTNTAPTTWIPVVSAVETTTETKYAQNAAWARVFHHNNHWGNILYSNETDAKSSNTVDKYSVLGNIANYKNSSNWEFMLQYPDVSSTGYNRWTQTVSPITSATSVGYTAVGTPSWTGNAWSGIALSSSSNNTLIDGSPNDGTWFYAIGAYGKWNGSVPGPNSTPISTVNLWARIDNLTNTTSANLTRRIGDLKSNTTYYVWVKDAAGNTASKSVTVSNVDTTAPTASITSTNNVATSQTATLTIGDTKALDKYYWGTSNPASTNVTYTATSGTSQTITKTVDAAGTYYLAVLDKAGNRTITSKAFYKTTLTPNRGTVSPTSVITMSGNSFTIPNPGAVTGYTWGGWYKESGLSTSAGTTWTPTASATLYGKWTINKYYLTYDYQDSYTYSGSDALDTGYKYNWDKNFKVEAKFKVTATGNRYCVFSSYNDTTKNCALEITTDNKLRVYMGSGSIDDKSSTAIPVNTDITATFQWNASTKTYTLTATGTNVNISMTNTLSSMTGTGTKNVLVGRDERTTTFKSINITMFKISTEYDYNTAISTLPTVTKPGYTYSGWYDAASGGNKVTSVTMPASNKTIYARKTANTYTITYDYNYLSGDIYESNPYITRSFSNATAAGTTSVADNTAAKYGKELRWTCTTAGAGGAHMNPGRLEVGKTYTWSVYVKASKAVTLGLGQEQGGKKNVNVTTSWQRFTYTFTATDAQYNSFTFYATGGSTWAVGDIMYMHSLELKEASSLNITTQTKTFGNTLGTLPTASRTGYTFNGWYTAPVGGTQIATTTAVPAANTTYYAHWTVNTYTLTVDPNGGTIPTTSGWTLSTNGHSKQIGSKTVTYGATYGTLPTPTRTGYTFSGWYNARTVDNITIAASTGNYNYKYIDYNIQPGVTYTLTLNAAKTAGSATNFAVLIYDFTDSASLAQVSTAFGTGKTVTITCPASADKTHKLSMIIYAGVNGSTANNAVSYTNIKLGTMGTTTSAQYTSSSIVATARNHTLYAIWTANKYKVTLDNQLANTTGTTAAWYYYKTAKTVNNVTAYYYSDEACTTPLSSGYVIDVPVKWGYTFGGYYTGTNGTGTQYVNASGSFVNSIYSNVAGNTTLYAKWTEKTYTATLYASEAANPTTGTVPYSDISFLGYAVNLRMTNNSPGYGTYTYKELTPLTSDPLFSSGQNNITAYDNNHTGKVTITRTVSNGGGILTITNAGGTATSPGLGGFVQSSGTVSANKKYVHIFSANLPSGYYFQQANNNMGTGATITWLTSNAGTGNYQLYAYQVNTGSAAGSTAFGNFGHVYVSTSPVRSTAAATGTYTMTLGYSNIFDITSNDAGIGMVDGSAVLTGKMTRDISNSNFTISPTEYIYDGTAKTPTPTVTDNRLDETLTLTKNTEYTIAYSNNTNVGTATATITGKNVFSTPTNTYYIGTKSATFYINNAKLTFNVSSNSGTISGTSPQYIRKGQTGVYTGIRNSTAGTIPTASRTGYTFTGWWTAASGGTKVINADKSIVASISGWTDASKNWLRTADSTLYAQFTPNSYTIKFNANGGSGSMSNLAMTYGTAKNLTSVTFTRAGYGFVGWATSSSGSATYTNGQSVSNLTSTAGGTVNLYAVWQKIQLWDKVNYNPGTKTSANVTLPAGASFSDTIKASDSSDWVVLNVDNVNAILIVPKYFSDSKLKLQGINGFNNSIQALNNTAGLYLNSTYATAARSLNVDDVNKVEGHTANGEVAEDSWAHRYSVDSNFNIVDNGEANSGVTRTYKTTATTGRYSYTTSVLPINSMSSYIYLASRTGYFDSISLNLHLRILAGGRVTIQSNLVGIYKYSYYGVVSESYDEKKVCPVVTLKSNLIIIKNGDTWDLSVASGAKSASTSNTKSLSSLSLSKGLTLNITDNDNTLENTNDGDDDEIQAKLDSVEPTETNEQTVNTTQPVETADEPRGTSEPNESTNEGTESSEEPKEQTDSEEPNSNTDTSSVQIAEISYSTISEAIASANSGDTITLEEDTILKESLEIPQDKEITLDLNGKVLSSTDISTIINNGTLTITGTSNGILKNESSNGIVIINKGELTADKAIITTAENGGKAIENEGGKVTVDSGKIVTEGIGSIGIYNEKDGELVIQKGIVEVRKSGSKAIYNEANLTLEKAQIVVADYDSIGIYNSKDSTSCEIKDTEIIIEADEIENYELIKNTDEFKAELEQMKPSYGIYNDSKKEVQIKTATIKVERLKGVGIINNSEGTIILGVDESKDGKEIDLDTASPIIYAIADNTTALINSKKGKINFYDGRILSTSTIKNIITNVLNNYEIDEEFDSNNICAFLKLIEVEEKSEEKNEVETKVDSNKEETVVETKEDDKTNEEKDTEEKQEETTEEEIHVSLKDNEEETNNNKKGSDK